MTTVWYNFPKFKPKEEGWYTCKFETATSRSEGRIYWIPEEIDDDEWTGWDVQKFMASTGYRYCRPTAFAVSFYHLVVKDGWLEGLEEEDTLLKFNTEGERQQFIEGFRFAAQFDEPKTVGWYDPHKKGEHKQ